ncbi:MAG: hypothetical protein DRH07_00205 [Deltaproteobacteria bacterium]|nr:MAG: hypothetical protein DRH07_00205 [Deltaproteobacteria bacterium]
MLHLIDELKVIPGVMGACIVNSQTGVKVSNLPAIFRVERLVLVGQHLLKIYAAGRMSFADLTDITLNYDESVVVARELEKNTLLFAICDPSFNQNLLTMSFNLLHEEFKLGNFVEADAEIVAPGAGQTTAPSPSAKGTISDPLKNLLKAMKASLGKILGPMAEFIFDEATDLWIEQGAPDFSRIEELVEQLDREIDDQDKSTKYRQLISSALKDFQKG